MIRDLMPGALLLWMGAGGIASWFAKRYGWGEWKWFLASIFTGPISWMVLYLKIRDHKEREGPKALRTGVPTHIDTV